jgi:acylphosphatase
MNASFIAVRVFAEGRVQGVGYREFVRRCAERRAVSGWVRNRADGSVEAWLCGPADTIEALVAEMRQGPRFADVAKLCVEAAEIEEGLRHGFAVKSTL